MFPKARFRKIEGLLAMMKKIAAKKTGLRQQGGWEPQ